MCPFYRCEALRGGVWKLRFCLLCRLGRGSIRKLAPAGSMGLGQGLVGPDSAGALALAPEMLVEVVEADSAGERYR